MKRMVGWDTLENTYHTDSEGSAQDKGPGHDEDKKWAARDKGAFLIRHRIGCETGDSF